MSLSFFLTGEAPSATGSVLAAAAGTPVPAFRNRHGLGLPCYCTFCGLAWLVCPLLALTAFCATTKLVISRLLYRHLIKPLADVFEFMPKF